MASNNENAPWHDLAEQVSKETDTRQLAVLVEQLCAALDKEINSRRGNGYRSDSQFDALSLPEVAIASCGLSRSKR